MADPFKLQRYPFDEQALQSAPDQSGLYVLWEGDELTYMGSAGPPGPTIRQRLLEHWSERDRSCSATHYSWRLALHHTELLDDWLSRHAAIFQALPRCNRPL